MHRYGRDALFISLLAFALGLAGVAWAHLSEQLGTSDAIDAARKLFSVYLVHIGMFAGVYFGSSKADVRADATGHRAGALALLLLWNAIALYGVAAYLVLPASDHSFTDLLTFLDTIPRETAPLVGGVSAFMTAKGLPKAG